MAARLLALVVVGVWVGATGDDEITLGLALVAFPAYWLPLVGAAVVASRRRGTGHLAADFGVRIERRDVVPGVVAGLFSQFVLLRLLYLPFEWLNPDLDVSKEARDLLDLASGAGLAVLVASVVLVAPVVEEVFFRGLLQRTLVQRAGRGWGVALTAVAFGVTHFQPVQLLGLVAFGAVLGVLAERAGRLGPAIVAHVTFNAATVIVLLAL